MVLTAVYDANVLYPAPLRDLLIRLAQADLVRARWTKRILDETFRAILRDRPDLTRRRLQRTRDLMCRAVRDCLVTRYGHLVRAIHLPDPDDRHVLAAAIRCSAQVVVTRNVSDFPRATLAPHGIEAQTPDELVSSVIDVSFDAVADAVARQAKALRRPPQTVAQLLGTLARNGLPTSVAKLRAGMGRGHEPLAGGRAGTPP